jgi:hypothetical protein
MIRLNGKERLIGVERIENLDGETDDDVDVDVDPDQADTSD